MTAPNIQVNVPSKPVTKGATGIGSQRDRRFSDTFHDIHKHPVRFPLGRPFTGEREFTSGTSEESIGAGFITSDLQPGEYFCEDPRQGQTDEERRLTLLSAWSAPWVPLTKYFRFNYRAKRISFAYEKMIADEREGLTRYWEAAAKLAGENDIIDPEHPLLKLLAKPRNVRAPCNQDLAIRRLGGASFLQLFQVGGFENDDR